MKYWDSLDLLVSGHKIVIDRPKGSSHPKYKEAVYPVDYGYLENTSAIDGGGVDIFTGSLKDNKIQGIICTVDSFKNDAEIKIMYNCTKDEIKSALDFLNKGSMSSIFVKNGLT